MPQYNDNYWGLTDWAWILLYEYNLLNHDETKYDAYDIPDDKKVYKLCNIRFGMTAYVKFDPSLIGA